jgi:uncharacterized protein YqjF (DUF2071 family)
MGQTWSNLLFAHWEVEPAALERVIPKELPLDLWEGRAWLGVTPFVVEGGHPRGMPALPWLGHFPELNTRTYVTVGGRPGIYFLSLDAARLAAVMAARRVYRLPYFHADMEVGVEDGRVRYWSERRSGDGPPASFRADYGRADGQLDGGEPLARWLAERYCLYTKRGGSTVVRADIHHPPWPLEPAWAKIAENTMGRPFGLELDGTPLLHFGARQDTVIWGPRAV